MRWSLYQLAQASAQTGEQGIAAKGVSGGGYEGHYFWDTECTSLPFLSYTDRRRLVRSCGSAGRCCRSPGSGRGD